jgi:hypothetical protein
MPAEEQAPRALEAEQSLVELSASKKTEVESSQRRG